MQQREGSNQWVAVVAVGAAAVAAAGFLSLWQAPLPSHRASAILGQHGTAAGHFVYLEDLDLDRHGNLYVVDRGTARVTVFDPTGRMLRSFGGRPQLQAPEGVAVDRRGNVLVGDAELHAVLKFAPGGELLWTAHGEGSQLLQSVGMIDVDDRDNVWVTDSGHHRIQVFDPTGRLMRSFGEPGSGPGQFRNPRCVHVDAATQSVYVTDYENDRVQKFDLEGRFVMAWHGPLGLDRPIGVTVHPLTGRVYVTEAGVGRVQVFEPDGRFVEAFGRSGTEPGAFRNLHGIVIDRRGTILVGDTGNSRIQVVWDHRLESAPLEEQEDS